MKVKGYRPYGDGEEFLRDYIKHNGVLYKEDKEYSKYCSVESFDDKEIIAADHKIMFYGFLLENYCWADDQSPCGVKKANTTLKAYSSIYDFVEKMRHHGIKVYYKDTEREYEIVSVDFITKDIKVVGFCHPFTLNQLFDFCLWADDHSVMGEER